MIRVGVTGSNGFVGYHLTQTLRLAGEEFKIIDFDRSFFDEPSQMDAFVSECDTIVHLAALNRHQDSQTIYATNIKLVRQLVESLDRTNSKSNVILTSSTQEERDNTYGLSKKEGRLHLSDWAHRSGGTFMGLIVPNVFGPFGCPNYNSVVATFCHQIARNIAPIIENDVPIKLIYVGELVDTIIQCIRKPENQTAKLVPFTTEAHVSDLLKLLLNFREIYQDRGEFPRLNNDFELKLFNTFRCYMDLGDSFPRKLVQHIDNRGSFVEITRHGIPGQASFSLTKSGVTRGNHFHTRKIERFVVIKGKALIQIRRIGTDKVYEFYVDGDEPAFVDMPIWHTHNIKNIGENLLYTIFWINEPFDHQDPDTWFEVV
jgi:UDP-2-acetamido-2,6-beta-L-arabino-hexul-4-ose reductase